MIFAATVTDACGSRPGVLCRWVFDGTGSTKLAEFVDWLVRRPFHIAVILVVAFVTNWLVRRAIRRLIERVVRDRDVALRDTGRDGDRQWLERLRERSERSRQRALTMASVLRSIASVIIYGLAVLLCLGELQIQLGPLIAGAGIAGLAIGFGAQTLVRDFLAGIFIVIEDQYGVGDTVDLGEAAGTVEKVTLRTTAVRDADGTLWVVPNGEIKRVANKSQRWARTVLDMRVAADADLEQTMAVMRAAATDAYERQPQPRLMLEAPEVLGVESFLDGAAVLRMTVKTEPGAQFRVGRALREQLKQAFDAAGLRALTTQPTAPGKNGPPRE